MRKLNEEFYNRSSLIVAEELIGKLLVRVTTEGLTSGIIIETEAYVGPEDKASHAYNWRRTKRNEAMFARGGTAYVYLIYGKYYCLNVVTSGEGYPDAVLLRAVYPLQGIELMAKRRGLKLSSTQTLRFLRMLTVGPGRLTQALSISLEDNGKSFLSPQLFIADIGLNLSSLIRRGKRIGVEYADEYAEKPWRFFVPLRDAHELLSGFRGREKLPSLDL